MRVNNLTIRSIMNPSQPQPNFNPADPTIAPMPLYVPPPVDSSQNKKLILIVGVILMIIAIIIGGAIFALQKQSLVLKADYVSASASAKDLATDLNKVFNEVSAISFQKDETEDELNDQLGQARQSVTGFKVTQKEFTNEKALKDKEIAELFRVYSGDQFEYIGIVDRYISSITIFGPEAIKCKDYLDKARNLNDLAENITELETCSNDLKALGRLADTDVANYVTATHESFDRYAELLQKYSDTTDTELVKQRGLRIQLSDLDVSFRQQTDDITRSINKKFEDKEPQDSLESLSKALLVKSLSTEK